MNTTLCHQLRISSRRAIQSRSWHLTLKWRLREQFKNLIILSHFFINPNKFSSCIMSKSEKKKNIMGLCMAFLRCVSLAMCDSTAATPIRVSLSWSSTIIVWIPTSIAWHVVLLQGTIANKPWPLSKWPSNDIDFIPHHFLLLLLIDTLPYKAITCMWCRGHFS